MRYLFSLLLLCCCIMIVRAQSSTQVIGRVMLPSGQSPAKYKFDVSAQTTSGIPNNGPRNNCDEAGNFILRFDTPLSVGDELEIRIQEVSAGIDFKRQVRLTLNADGQLVANAPLRKPDEEALFRREFGAVADEFWDLLKKVADKGSSTSISEAQKRQYFQRMYAMFDDGKEAIVEVSNLTTGTVRPYTLETYLNRLATLPYKSIEVVWEIREITEVTASSTETKVEVLVRQRFDSEVYKDETDKMVMTIKRTIRGGATSFDGTPIDGSEYKIKSINVIDTRKF